jgi:hypothetical protein
MSDLFASHLAKISKFLIGFSKSFCWRNCQTVWICLKKIYGFLKFFWAANIYKKECGEAAGDVNK